MSDTAQPRRNRMDPALRAQVLAEEPWCTRCGAPAAEAGFVLADTAGGAAVRENLTGRCGPCHRTVMISDRIAARSSAPR